MVFPWRKRALLWQWIIALEGTGTTRKNDQFVSHLHDSLGRAESGLFRLPNETDCSFGNFVARKDFLLLQQLFVPRLFFSFEETCLVLYNGQRRNQEVTYTSHHHYYCTTHDAITPSPPHPNV